jgi:hypothetical protein
MRNAVLLSGGLVVCQILGCGSNDSSSSSPSGVGGETGATHVGGATATSTSSSGGTTEATAPANGGATTPSPDTSGGASTSLAAGGSAATSSPSSGGASTSAPTSTSSSTASPYAGKLVINEVCPSNKSGASDESGAFPDWLELYNGSSADINLKGFFISNDQEQLTKFMFNKDTLVVKAGGVLLLWADKDESDGDAHLSFKLSASGEVLTLSDPDRKVVDSMTWTNAGLDITDKSYSRLPDGTGAFAWCAKGTPNKLNGSACQ